MVCTEAFLMYKEELGIDRRGMDLFHVACDCERGVWGSGV